MSVISGSRTNELLNDTEPLREPEPLLCEFHCRGETAASESEPNEPRLILPCLWGTGRGTARGDAAIGAARGDVQIEADIGDEVLLGIARGDDPACGEVPGIWIEGRRALGNVAA